MSRARPIAHLGSLLLLASCAALPQEPAGREIQPLPARAMDATEFAVDVSFGGGSFHHRTSSSTLDGDANAAWVRLRFEVITDADIGGGFALEGTSAERHLFEDSGDNDTDTGGSDLFVFFGLRPGRGSNFEVPVRIGFFGSRYSIHDLNSADIDYPSLGARIEIEPEWVLTRSGDHPALSLFGEAAFGAGNTRVETSPATVKADADTVLYGFELGGRFRTGGAVFGLGWVFRGQHIDSSETVNGVSFNGIDTEFSGLQVSIGGRF